MKNFMKEMAIVVTIVLVIGFVCFNGYFLHKELYPPAKKATWTENFKAACGIKAERPNPSFLERVDSLVTKTINSMKPIKPEPTLWEKTKSFSNDTWDKTKNVTKESWEKTKSFSNDTWDKTKNVTKESWEKTKSFSSKTWNKISPEKTKS